MGTLSRWVYTKVITLISLGICFTGALLYGIGKAGWMLLVGELQQITNPCTGVDVGFKKCFGIERATICSSFQHGEAVLERHGLQMDGYIFKCLYNLNRNPNIFSSITISFSEKDGTLFGSLLSISCTDLKK